MNTEHYFKDYSWDSLALVYSFPEFSFIYGLTKLSIGMELGRLIRRSW